jgi:Topoisomerase IA
LSNGWKSIYKHEIQEAADQKEEPTLPQVQENDVVEFSSGDIIEKITKPPVRFNPSTLLKAMKEIYKYVKDSNLKTVLKECSGIGTEATRASIIDKLQSTGFLALEKKYLVPTEKANMIISVLSDDITYPDTTALWEKGLEDISQQNLSLIDFFEQQIAMLNEFLEKANSIKIEAPKNAVLCPVCKKPMLRRKGPKEFFWGCSGYPKCKSTAADKKGKPDFTPRRKK